MIAAKIDLSHIATDIIYSEVLICKGDSTGKANSELCLISENYCDIFRNIDCLLI